VKFFSGDILELKLEKSSIPEKKKGPRSKAVTAAPPAIIRVLYQGQEVKKNTQYAFKI